MQKVLINKIPIGTLLQKIINIVRYFFFIYQTRGSRLNK